MASCLLQVMSSSAAAMENDEELFIGPTRSTKIEP